MNDTLCSHFDTLNCNTNSKHCYVSTPLTALHLMENCSWCQTLIELLPWPRRGRHNEKRVGLWSNSKSHNYIGNAVLEQSCRPRRLRNCLLGLGAAAAEGHAFRLSPIIAVLVKKDSDWFESGGGWVVPLLLLCSGETARS